MLGDWPGSMADTQRVISQGVRVRGSVCLSLFLCSPGLLEGEVKLFLCGLPLVDSLKMALVECCLVMGSDI